MECTLIQKKEGRNYTLRLGILSDANKKAERIEFGLPTSNRKMATCIAAGITSILVKLIKSQRLPLHVFDKRGKIYSIQDIPDLLINVRRGRRGKKKTTGRAPKKEWHPCFPEMETLFNRNENEGKTKKA